MYNIDTNNNNIYFLKLYCRKSVNIYDKKASLDFLYQQLFLTNFCIECCSLRAVPYGEVNFNKDILLSLQYILTSDQLLLKLLLNVSYQHCFSWKCFNVTVLNALNFYQSVYYLTQTSFYKLENILIFSH